MITSNSKYRCPSISQAIFVSTPLLVIMHPTGHPKKQTRLTFTPLSSSPPQATTLPSQMQSRAANVRYDDQSSPFKKRRLPSTISEYLSRPPMPSRRGRPRTSISSADDIPIVEPSPKISGTFIKRPYRALPTPEPSSQFQLGEVGPARNRSVTITNAQI